VDGGDRFSDLDFTFGIADHVPVADVLKDWTRTLIDELDAVHLADLERRPTHLPRVPAAGRRRRGRRRDPYPEGPPRRGRGTGEPQAAAISLSEPNVMGGALVRSSRVLANSLANTG
jgi:hypothetical protein